MKILLYATALMMLAFKIGPGEPIKGVNITMKGKSSIKGITDKNGGLTVDKFQPGKYNLEFKLSDEVKKNNTKVKVRIKITDEKGKVTTVNKEIDWQKSKGLINVPFDIASKSKVEIDIVEGAYLSQSKEKSSK